MAHTAQKEKWINPTQSISVIPNTNAQHQTTMKADVQPHPGATVKALADKGGFSQCGIGCGTDGTVSTEMWKPGVGDDSQTSAVDSGEDTSYT